MEPFPVNTENVNSPESTSLTQKSLYGSAAVIYATHFWNSVDVINQQGFEPRSGAQLVGSLILTAYFSKHVVNRRSHFINGQQK